MNEKSTKRIPSARVRIMAAVTLVQIPLIVLYFFLINNFTSRFMQEQWGYQATTLDTYVSEIEDEIQKIDQFLYTRCQTGDLTQLQQDAYGLIDENLAVTQLLFFDQDGVMTELVMKPGTNDNLTVILQEDTGWRLTEQNSKYYLMRNADCPLGKTAAVISVDRLAAASSNNYHIPGSVLFLRGNTRLNTTLWQRNANTELPASVTEPYLLEAGKRTYMLSENKLIGMRVLYGVIYNYDFSWLYYFGYTMLGVALITLFVTLYYMNRTILKPLKQMSGVMDEIGSGDMDKRLPEGKTSELAQISGTFNTMMDHLKHAKIESYEQRLTARRAKMDALRLQIRRHFFLNCLKNIYAMASVGDVESIKRTSLLLSSNLRYTLNFDADSVPLREELKMCEDYIELQGVGQTYKPMLVIDSTPELDNFAIPPVSLLTILENCCKYGTKQGSPLVIRIHTEIRALDDAGYAMITVRDNGNGYDPAILKMLNQDMEQIKEQNHIGLANTLLRFRMLYGEDCSILFSNSGGAKIDLMIPMPKEEVGDETVDRG